MDRCTTHTVYFKQLRTSRLKIVYVLATAESMKVYNMLGDKSRPADVEQFRMMLTHHHAMQLIPYLI
jgi:hypothetical protein